MSAELMVDGWVSAAPDTGRDAAFLLLSTPDTAAAPAMAQVAEDVFSLGSQPGWLVAPSSSDVYARLEDGQVYVHTLGDVLQRPVEPQWAQVAQADQRVVLVIGYKPKPLNQDPDRYESSLARSVEPACVIGLLPLRDSAQADAGDPAAVIATQLGDYLVAGHHYPQPLPPALQRWYCYTSDGGHNILVLLEHLRPPEAPITDYLCPAPVKAVLRVGWRDHEGYVACDLPYDKQLGLLTEDDDDEW